MFMAKIVNQAHYWCYLLYSCYFILLSFIAFNYSVVEMLLLVVKVIFDMIDVNMSDFVHDFRWFNELYF